MDMPTGLSQRSSKKLKGPELSWDNGNRQEEADVRGSVESRKKLE